MLNLTTQLAGVLAETRGVWNKAQAKLFIELAARSAEQQQWQQASEHLLRLAKLSTEQTLGALSWRAILSALIKLALQGAQVAQLAETVEQYMWLGWSGQQVQSLPWEIVPCFELAQDEEQQRAAAFLGDLLARQYPSFAYGPYASAHFRELERIRASDLEPTFMRANAARFERAAALAQEHKQRALARHCALRQGVSLMLGGIEKSQGRALLKGLKPDQLNTRERVWYMWGMSRSDFWLDRVRAADILDELAQLARQDKPEARALRPGELEQLLDGLLWRAGLELHPSEEDRLLGLIPIIQPPDKRARTTRALALATELEQLKQVRVQADEAKAFEQTLTEAADELGESWRRAASSYRFLRQLSDPDFIPDADYSIPREAPEPFLQGAQLSLELLLVTKRHDLGGIEHQLQRVRRALTEDLELLRHPERLTPLSAAWPDLIKLIPKPLKGAAAQATEPDQEQQQLEYIQELLIHAIERWATRAPRPGYGWWALAAQLLEKGLSQAAYACAKRGLDQGAQPEERKLQEHVIGKILAQVIERGDHLEMLQWLEAADRIS